MLAEELRCQLLALVAFQSVQRASLAELPFAPSLLNYCQEAPSLAVREARLLCPIVATVLNLD